MRRSFFLLLTLLGITPLSKAQIGTGEWPMTVLDTVIGDSINDSLITTFLLTPPPIDALDTNEWGEGEGDTIAPYILKFGVEIPTNIDFMEQSDVYNFESGELRLLKIRSIGAHSLSFVIDDYWMPPGATLHMYSEDRQHYIGGFTDFNNRSDSLFATQLVRGEAVILEYFQPVGTSGEPVIFITSVTHDYMDFFNDDLGGGVGKALPCSPNAACEVGDPWRDEIRAAVRLSLGGGSFSGVLLNNVLQDGTAYVLTALHAFDDADGLGENAILSPHELQRSRAVIAYFNFQTFDCITNDDTYDGKDPNPTLGAGEVVAFKKETDFALIRFENPPPLSYAPYYAGWDANDEVPEVEVACISHPVGDRKKLALTNLPPVSSGNIFLNWIRRDGWRVTFQNGYAEPGSSGAGLFERGGYVVGQCMGGAREVDCDDPNQSSYGRLHVSWDGSDSTNRLRDWLDPTDTDIRKISGMDPICQAGITIDSRTYGAGVTDSERGWVQIQTAFSVDVEDGAQVTYAARSNVKLMPGFAVAHGGEFLATVDPQEDCPSHPITAIIGDNAVCRNAHSTWNARTIFGKPPYTHSWTNNRTSETSFTSSFTRWVGLLDRDFMINLQVTDEYGHVATANKPINSQLCKRDEVEVSLEQEPKPFALYPNPTDARITLLAMGDMKGGAEVEVFNTLGDRVTSFHFTGETTMLDLGAYGSGMYIVNIFSGGILQSERILVE